MTIEPIDSFSKKEHEKKSTPNVGRFKKEIEKIQETSETEFEKPKKRPGFEEEEEEPRSPFQMISKENMQKVFSKPLIEALKKEKEKKLPSSDQFYKDVGIDVSKEVSLKEKKSLKEAEKEKPTEKEIKKETPFIATNRPVFAKEKKEEKVQKTTDENVVAYKTDWQSLPASIQTQATEITAALSPSMGLDLSLLTEKMIGVILYSSQEGISQTEVILNSPDMQGSIFYGAVITVEKYASAPDSFNIRLTGSPEAVTVFSSNIDGLRENFQNANVNFRIGTLSAEYALERPLFRRKERPGGMAGGGADTSGRHAR